MCRALVVLLLLCFPILTFAADKPEGTIAYASLAPRGWDLYVADVDSLTHKRLTTHPSLDFNASISPDGKRLAFISERDGNMEIYSAHADGSKPIRLTKEYALDDHVSWSPDGKQIVFTSTREPIDKPGQSWNALYLMNADGTGVKRLSPKGVSDYSPAWSSHHNLIAFVSPGKGIGVMKPDGSERRMIIKNGGWPTFVGKQDWIYYHRKDKGWGIWRARLDGSEQKRVTPKTMRVSMPSGSPGSNLLAVVRNYRGQQSALLDPGTAKLTLLMERGKCWNPSLSPDGKRVYYHQQSRSRSLPKMEWYTAPPSTKVKLTRVVGMFPRFSPDHKHIAFIDRMKAVSIINNDGSDYKKLWSGKGLLFGLSWDPSGDRLTFSRGGYFQKASREIEIASIRPDGTNLKTMIADGSNNGWVSFSPDGKQFVFRSGRSGKKNLYLANRDGSNIRQLTKGKWTDTMPHWSPKGDWIVFSSNRDRQFHLWLIKPDGSGLRKLLGGAQHNHPHFSPDAKWVVFTSGQAGYSFEPISFPGGDQIWGELFAVRVDGTGLVRLTHNGSADGTPDWGPTLKK